MYRGVSTDLYGAEIAMHVIVHIARGPNWLKGRPVYEQGEPVEGHLTAMRSLYDSGRLLIGGPFRGKGKGGIAVLRVDDLPAAKALMDADPAVVAGVMTYSVDELTAVFDAFSGTRTNGTAIYVGRMLA